MDAFGQHYASAGRFDDEEPLDVVMTEARIYYANILMLYGKQVGRVLDRASTLPIETIATSHGVIWRKHIPEIVAAYRTWSQHKARRRVLVIYDTMWNSTERMAEAVVDGVLGVGADVRMLSIKGSHITEIATEALEAACIAVGSPTLNMSIMPQMGAVLTYLEGLRPENKTGFVFGSYGWAKSGQKTAEDYLKRMKIPLIGESVSAQFAPTAEELAQCREAGRKLGEKALSVAGG